MTDAVMSLRALAETSAHADVLREVIGFAAQRLMGREVGDLTGEAHGEKNLKRSSCRSRSSRRGATSRASWRSSA
jgi:putative transposase